MNKPELVVMQHSNGKMFIEIDSLIEWFESDSGDSDLNKMGKFVAYTLRGMKERSQNNPTRVMTEEQYYNKETEH